MLRVNGVYDSSKKTCVQEHANTWGLQTKCSVVLPLANLNYFRLDRQAAQEKETKIPPTPGGCFFDQWMNSPM